MDIVQMSFSASIFIVVTVIIRAIALYRLPKKTFLVLWGIAVLRLLVPFSIPSRFSLYTGLDMLKNLFAQNADKDTQNGVPIALSNTVHMPGAEVGAGISTPTLAISAVEVIWLAGICVCALFFIIAYVKFHREFKMALPVENEVVACWLKEHPLHRHMQIRQTDQIKAPLTYGIFRPVILLPNKTNWADEKQLRYVLTHEYVHIRHFDTLTKLVLTFAVCIHWFNPFVWVMYILTNRDIELSCDETVVRNFGENLKSAYALTLIGLEETKGRLSPLVNYFSKNAIEERIVSIMKIKKKSLVGIIMAVTLVIGTAVAFATSAVAADSSTKSGQIDIEAIDRKMNQEETTSEVSSMMMSYVGETDGKTYYSWDDGTTWTPLTDEEYEDIFPTPVVEWWTYEEYKSWLDNQKAELKNMIGETIYRGTEGWYVFTQEEYDQTISLYESILADIKSGIMVSKSVDGDENMMMVYTPSDIEMGTGDPEYSILISLDNGEEANFGPYSTKEEMLAVVKPYCEEQVKLKKMSQQEADEILNKYK